MTAEPELTIRNAGFICGGEGCDSFGRFVRCDTCGWSITLPPDAEPGGQLILGAEPEHTPWDCARYQRDHPRPTYRRGTAKQNRAHTAYRRIHERHEPARMRRQHGVLVCPRCGFQP